MIIHEMPPKDAEKTTSEKCAPLYSGMDENYGAVMPYNFCRKLAVTNLGFGYCKNIDVFFFIINTKKRRVF